VGVSVKVQKIAKLCAIALTICVLSPISASGYGTKLDNGRDWFELPGALRSSSQGVATSGDGQFVYTLEPSNVRFSSDGGATWSDRGAGVDWSSSGWDLATSTNGQYVVISANGGYIHTSNNYGVTWVKKTGVLGGCWGAGQGQWRRASMSYSGQYQVVMENCGTIQVSSDYGVTFTERIISSSITGNDAIADVEMSGDGSRIIVPTDARFGKVYLSSNFGGSFSEISALTYATKKSWTTVEISGDGQTLLACASQDNIWVSRDGGSTWRESLLFNNPAEKDWVAATISYDGNNIGIGRTGTILTSSDGGSSWESRPGAPSSRWVGMASSRDGFIMYGNAGGARIYKSLPSWIWFDAGTVTIFHKCTSDTSTVTSVQAQSVTLILDSATVASDTSTYHYYTETNTALWGATYNYGQKQSAEDCSYSDMTGTMTLARGPFIASSGAAYSETSTIGANDDFVQYIGNTNPYGAGYFGDNNCGNLTVPNLNVANSCDFIDLAKQGDWPRLNVGISKVVRSAYIRSGISLPKTGVQRTPLDPATIFVVVKAKKALMALAPVGTSWVASETFTVTCA